MSNESVLSLVLGGAFVLIVWAVDNNRKKRRRDGYDGSSSFDGASDSGSDASDSDSSSDGGSGGGGDGGE